MPTEQEEAREALEILEETERFLFEEMCSGKMTRANQWHYVRGLRETRDLIARQKGWIASNEGK